MSIRVLGKDGLTQDGKSRYVLRTVLANMKPGDTLIIAEGGKPQESWTKITRNHTDTPQLQKGEKP